MIGGSIIVFGIDAFLTDESALQITTLGPVQNFLFFVSILLLIVWIYFIVSSRACPACGEKVHRADLTADIADGFLKFLAYSEEGFHPRRYWVGRDERRTFQPSAAVLGAPLFLINFETEMTEIHTSKKASPDSKRGYRRISAGTIGDIVERPEVKANFFRVIWRGFQSDKARRVKTK